MLRLFSLLLSGVLILSSASANEIQFIEDFALATDRDAVIERLIPGTDEYYFYRCLHLQNQQKYASVEPILKEWSKRHGNTGWWQQIARRQALFTYPSNSTKALSYLEKNLGLKLDHRRRILNEKPRRPTSLDPNLISGETLRRNALKENRNLNRFTDEGLRRIDAAKLAPHLRREYLTRLRLPDVPGLAELIVKDLKHKGSRGFGSLNIHRKLTARQLEQCSELLPALLGNAAWIDESLKRLQPTTDLHWKYDDETTKAYLDRLWAFVRPLNASQHSLKAHVLYNRLLFESGMGAYSRQLFLEYLKLPRPVSYVNPRFMKSFRGVAVDLNYDCSETTLFPPIRNDEPLVRKFLLHFLEKDASPGQFAEYIEENYLKQLFAEAKLLAGAGDAEKWFSMLPATSLRALRDRVDIEFAPDNPRIFAADDDVKLNVHIKNVDKLIVKVFEINTPSYYRQYQREVNTDIDLDGLVPNHEQSYAYNQPPLRRVLQEFDFPECKKPGVYVVDFIGNGVSSRAVIRKGKHRIVTSTMSSGQAVRVFDENNVPLKDAKIWMAGREYESNERGYILIPFSTQAATHNVVVQHDGVASLHTMAHLPEKYRLHASLFVDRESLRKHDIAKLVIRAGLTLNGQTVSLRKLQEVRLRVSGTDLDGIKTEMDVPEFELFDDRESVHEIHIPARLASLAFKLSGSVQKLTDGEDVELDVSENVTMNGIERTQHYAGLHLAKVEDDYHLEVRGKSGEILTDRVVSFTFAHRDVTGTTSLTLQSDREGRIQLGKLTGIVNLVARLPEGMGRAWEFDGDDRSQYDQQHAIEGESITIPYIGLARNVGPDDFALFEERRGAILADKIENIQLDEGFITLEGLSAGDYRLWLKETGKTIRIHVTRGKADTGFAMGSRRLLELRGNTPLHITDVTSNDENVTIRLANAGEYSRVHVFANRYEHGVDHYSPFFNIGDRQPLASSWGPYISLFASGRDIGDELRYIIDRQYAQKFPGNMLKRPGLLLNPWELRETETKLAELRDGEEFVASDEADDDAVMESESRSRGRKSRRFRQQAKKEAAFHEAGIDWLAEGTAVAINLKPNKEGVIILPRKVLGAHQRVHVVAVDPVTTVYRQLALAESPVPVRDLRLIDNLDPSKHFTRQKQISVLKKGDEFVIDDVTSARFDQYDNLSAVYNLLVTLGQNEWLKSFSFIRDWPTLADDEKRDRYSEFACHELHFFLYHKDREFFDEIVRPYLANKMHKTFMDDWLLDENLEAWIEPWQFNQLNVAERILLGQKLAGQRDTVKRHVHDLYTLKPVSNLTSVLGFESAVAGKRLFATNENVLADRFAGRTLSRQPARGATMSGLSLGSEAKAVREKLSTVEEESLRRLAETAPGQDRSIDGLYDGGRQSGSGGFAGGGLGGGGGYGGGAFGDMFGGEGVDLDVEMEGAYQRLYRKLEATREWAENNYYRLPITSQNSALIGVDSFWHDYAQRDLDSAFYSEKFTEAAGSFTESMLALSVLDLPFESSDHKRKYDQAKLTINAAGPVIMFHEQVREVEAGELDSTILISQNFFRHGERHEIVDGLQRDKFITDEFVIHTVYGCQVVVTNTSSSPQNVDVLLQIPQGAIPMLGSKYTQTVSVQLPAYSTKSQEYHFYFPTSGQLEHFPVHVSKDEKIVALANSFRFNVVDEPSRLDTKSWSYVSQNGSNEEVIDFLKANNLQHIDLGQIAFRMADKAFFEQVTGYLQNQHAFNSLLWAYGVKHNSPVHIQQLLLHRPDFLGQLGNSIDCELLQYDPVEHRTYQHLDYRPLVNARAHQLGRKRTILNGRLHAQYHALMWVLAYQPALDIEDNLAVTYYMLLQDRIGEAMEYFAKVDRETLASKIQYDYLAAYLDCYQNEPDTARQLAAAYSEHPVPRWRKAFGGIKNMLDELDGKAPTPFDEKDRTEAQTQLAENAPNFEFEVDGGKINLTYANIKDIEINYYLMDLELLFSRNPFIQQFTGQFSSIRPNEVQSIELSVDRKNQVLELPESMRNQNVLIEIRGEGKTQSRAYYSNDLTIQLSEDYGQVRVKQKDSDKPLSTAYVKVYAQMNNGAVQFYKDGYTDIRGRFDYASLNTSELDNVGRFSLLILSEEYGAVVREARPPKR